MMEEVASSRRVITLEGQRLAHAGRLRQVSWDEELADRVTAAGGLITDTVSDTLTLFVTGERAGSKQIKAMTRGALLISEAEFVELLEHGSIEVETRLGLDYELELEQAFGEVRSLLAQPPRPDSWGELLTVVERCDEAQLAPLVHYINAHIDTWGAHKPWVTTADNALFTGFYPPYWITGMPRAHMCVAPPIWMLEALRHQRSSRHGLARALNVEGMNLNSGLATRLLDHPGWTRILALNLGIQNTYAQGFFHALVTHPLMQHVEELWVNEYPVGLFGFMEVDTSIFPSLKVLRCRYPTVRYRVDASPEAIDSMREESGWIREDVVIKRMEAIAS